MQLKILSYNIHKGLNWAGRKVTIHSIKKAILESGADVVFLQEIVGENKRHEENYEDWPKGHQLEFLADNIWKDFAYAKNAVYSTGNHGNAILSKFPIISWSHQNISTNRFEQRGLLYCNIEIPGSSQILHAYCLHLDLFHKGRRKQYETIYKRISNEVQMGEPVIVAGDFNDWNKRCKDIFEDSLGMNEVFKSLYGQYAKTFPAQIPLLSLDRIYVKNLQIDSGKIFYHLPWKNLSDHLPLYAEFGLADGKVNLNP